MWFDIDTPQATKIQLTHSCAHATRFNHCNEAAFRTTEHIFGFFFLAPADTQTKMEKEYSKRKKRGGATAS